MFLQSIIIEKDSFITDIVRQDYRTAGVFNKYNIDFCCGGKWALGIMCEIKGLEFDMVKKELETAIRSLQISNSLPFNDWSIEFLTEYIINIHHYYLRDTFPGLKDHLKHFVEDHVKKYPYLEEVQNQFTFLYKNILPHLQQEEEILFPYICQISHAYGSKEPYAGLLVRTLRKPLEDVMQQENDIVSKVLLRFRELTNNYIAPEDACVSHRVAFSQLKELDNDLVQHIYLEHNILFPKAIEMEKELLKD